MEYLHSGNSTTIFYKFCTHFLNNLKKLHIFNLFIEDWNIHESKKNLWSGYSTLQIPFVSMVKALTSVNLVLIPVWSFWASCSTYPCLQPSLIAQLFPGAPGCSPWSWQRNLTWGCTDSFHFSSLAGFLTELLKTFTFNRNLPFWDKSSNLQAETTSHNQKLL